MKLKLFIGFLSVASMLSSCGGGSASTQKSELPNYEIITLNPVDRTVNYSFPAILKGANDVEVFPQVTGRITEILYTTGALVKKGQPLVKIESTQQRMEVNTQKANVQAAESVVASAKLKYESQKKLFEKQIVSSFVMNTAENDYKTAQAQLAQAKAQLIIAETELNRCTVVSPIAGIVSGKPYKVGALVGPSIITPLTTVSDQTTIFATFSVPETIYTQLIEEKGLVNTSNGFKATNTQAINFSLMLKGGKMFEHKGSFSNLSGILDSATGTASLEITFPNPEGILHSGNTANVIIPYDAQGVLVLPQTACKKLQDKYLVYKVDANGLAVGVVVDVYPTNDGKEYIIGDESLKPGDEILASGVSRVLEGQKIK